MVQGLDQFGGELKQVVDDREQDTRRWSFAAPMAAAAMTIDARGGVLEVHGTEISTKSTRISLGVFTGGEIDGDKP